MRFKFNWIISFCLVAFISLFNVVSAFAASVASVSYNSLQGYYNGLGAYSDNSWSNVVWATCPNPYNPKATVYYIFYSNSPIVFTSMSNGVLSTNSSVSHLNGCVTTDDMVVHDWGGSFGLNPVKSDLTQFFVVKGSATADGKVVAVDPTASKPLSDSDILGFNWQGDGIKIYNLKPNMNVSGYEDNQLRWFDVECYGQFTYQGSDCLFPMFNYSSMKTQILRSSIFKFGAMTRNAGEGFGVKNGDEGFKWISNTNQLKKGDVVRFRVVYQAPLLEKGTYSVTVGSSLPNGSGDGIYLSDTVSDLNFLNQNADYGLPMDTSGSSGNVQGDTPGNVSQSDSQKTNPDTAGKSPLEILGMVSTSILDFFKSIVSVSTNLSNIMPALTTMFATMFAFFPSPIPQLITTATGIIIFVAVLKFLRG